ncbi:MAG TPA: AraC family transcriptional regulator [Saprospirales bacterium]|nr:AraC family transcriptional regulator [Saprospirales bacterium]
MRFDFNLFSTPLLFAFLQGWIYALLFLARGWRQGRLSDGLFGALLIAFTFDIWEYMLGFAGVEILWKELNFFPRTFSLLLPPLVFFYLKSQFNIGFTFKRKDALHALPFLIYCLYHLLVFAQGPTFVNQWLETVHQPLELDLVYAFVLFCAQLYYFISAYRLYREYQIWIPTEFSDTDTVSFSWFRNFLLAYLAGNLMSWIMFLVDLWLRLDFWHDWWDELFLAGLIYYLSIAGYAQLQPRKIQFTAKESSSEPVPARQEKLSEPELLSWKNRIEKLMQEDQLFLEPELTLSDIAQRLGTNISLLSSVVNNAFGKNFNDYVNTYRVALVKDRLKDPAFQHYSLLGIGLECGFNSKSTFNRVFKKITGYAPGDYVKGS